MNNCKYCNNQIPNRKQFCNRECSNKYKTTKIEKSCTICGEMFTIRPKELKGNRGKYCSIKCRDIGRYNDTHEEICCKMCNKKIIVYKNNPKQFCSWECQQKWNKLPKNISNRVQKSQNTALKKHGMYYFQTSEFQKKSKQTKLEKYGNENYVNSKQAKRTKLEKYGNENYNNIFQHKITCLKNYGVDNFAKTPQFKLIHKNKVMKKLFNNKFSSMIRPLFTIEDYSGIEQSYMFQCVKCGTSFQDHLNNGRIPRCPRCYPIKSVSFAEEEIRNFLSSFIMIKNDRTILSGKELDIVLPDKKIAIEYDGLYWHSELSGGKDKNYHLNKTILCEQQGYRLIHIFDDEWINKQKIVKSRLNYVLGIFNKKIYARQTSIREISPQQKNDFLEEVHLQGADKSKIKLGAFYKDELVSVMTFGNKRIALGSSPLNNEYELIRFASKYVVVGMANKFLSFFIKNYKPKSIITYADRRWSSGKVYEIMGFTKISDGTPGYWYIKKGQRFHRFNFRKHLLSKKLKSYDPALTEWENMQLNGYDRIWDCGHIKYELNCLN